MAFCDLLRTTSLLAGGSATALAAIAVISANRTEDTLALIVAAAWWTLAVVLGVVLGRPARAADAMREVLVSAKTTPTLPLPDNLGRAALARLWPLGAFLLIAGGVGIFFPSVAAIGAGFGIAAALAWRGRDGAVAAIEERDGVRFYVEPGSAFEPIRVIRTPGLRRDPAPLGAPPPPPI